MPKRTRKKAEDVNETAFRVVRESTGEATSPPPSPSPREKNPAAVELGRRGGLIGGRKRAENLTKEQLQQIGRLGAKARWGKKS